ncbi:MAG: hypothetical protein IPF83_04745 [Rhodanobacteraceae bacterium]|nr:hypothetical protein [Rhodanobacteraceae bacterium]
MNDDSDNLSLFIQLTIGLVHVNALEGKIARIELTVRPWSHLQSWQVLLALIQKQRA